jgi:hypothetical protein
MGTVSACRVLGRVTEPNLFFEPQFHLEVVYNDLHLDVSF